MAGGISPGRPDDDSIHPVIEIYPDVVWRAAQNLRAHEPGTVA